MSSLRFTTAGATPVGETSIAGSRSLRRGIRPPEAPPTARDVSRTGVVGVKLAKRARGVSPCAGVRGRRPWAREPWPPRGARI
jgi:hypothetical protein